MIEATFTDISNWDKKHHYSTGGTRSKYIAVHPEKNIDYFFKGSKETPLGEIRYETEFWSEIVSSKIGNLLGFPMLDYNIGYDKNHKQQIGCLSKTMIQESYNKLTEGVTYLTGYSPSYNPDTDKRDYTFQFISKALKKYGLERYINNIIEIVIFDSIIGNSDRHQENWGIISSYKMIKVDLDEPKIEINKGILDRLTKIFTQKTSIKEIEISTKDNLSQKYRFQQMNYFAPIYDSGCCLGREHTDDRVKNLIKDEQMLNAYIKRGVSEIHWEGNNKKSNHFDLVNYLLEHKRDIVVVYIERVKKEYNSQHIKEVIFNIDKHLPEELIKFKLSNERKELMFKLVTLRIEKLIDLI
ncbi:hypothetical protein V1389_11770 [Flavobacterium rakeshii]|uniref:hypothetical protein n=1 Tax=Flavobacterium rakeshii TaxID=1038845 RepID=UPI002E7B2BF8|nr:hypothetical protein [Flavobacterium rakeshii]MEE1899020.1 hypothetical protein [Flavobacterium rakeshii]